ncbi:hypothetical protein BDL97_13G124200 [Sphagnum fallax]|nr:hypothetical protein BDL97_13G124200 [Sphagnum fallax]KAH8944661.1 hypothetical protein BDL97_13G124200 [Sphagnum fallax]
MTTARAFISSWVVPQLSSGSKRNNLGFGKLGFMRQASPCPYPRATLARSIIRWWRSPAGRFNCSPQSLRLDIIMGALSNGYKAQRRLGMKVRSMSWTSLSLHWREPR